MAAVLAAGAAFAQVFKWVDERGVTHYGERPPQGAKASEVQNKLASPPPGTSGAPSGAPKDAGGGSRAASKEPPGKPRPSQETVEQVEASNRQQLCEQQRAILARMKENPASYTLNEKGEKVPADPDAIAQQEKRVITQCR